MAKGKPQACRGRWALPFVPLLVVVAGGCGASSSHEGRIAPLAVTYSKIPPLEVPYYETSGVVPQVSRPGMNLSAVNSALRDLVLADQRQYARAALKMDSRTPVSFVKRNRGTYDVFAPGPNPSNSRLEPHLISASTIVVSALIPTLELFPGGNDGQGFLSLTVRVPSGSPVAIGDLFEQHSHGLRVLAEAFRKRVVATNSCVARDLRSPVAGDLDSRGFAPTASNYRHFALTSRGVAVGFPLGQIAAPVCNSVEATVPYSVLRPYLSELGKELIAGVRAPRSS